MSFGLPLYQKRFFTKVIILTLIIFLCGCVTTEYSVGTHRQDIFLYSTEKEVAIGKSLAKEISHQLEISNNPLYIERLNKIASKIVEVCDRKEINYYFYVIDEDKKNALSLPGGYVYVYKGLMDILEDDELAFVVAHEIAHIVSRHAIKKLQAAMGANLIILATTRAKTSPNFHEGLSFALAQVMVAYSREDEFNADELAAKYLELAGFDSTVGIDVLDKLYREHKKEPLREFS